MTFADFLWSKYGDVVDSVMIAEALSFLQEMNGSPVDVQNISKGFRGDYSFSAERFSDIREELVALHKLHWEETEKHAAHIPLNPDYDMYNFLDNCGRMVFFVIRHNGEVVGDCMMKLNTSMHHQRLTASEDALFLKKEHRGGGTAMAFVKYVMEVLREMDVSEIRVSSKMINHADKFMMRAGFKPVATQLIKMLD